LLSALQQLLSSSKPRHSPGRAAAAAEHLPSSPADHDDDDWHCPHRMRSRVYEAVQSASLSIRLSVCLSIPACPPSGKSAAGLLLGARRAGDIDLLLQWWWVNVGNAMLSAFIGS